MISNDYISFVEHIVIGAKGPVIDKDPVLQFIW